MGSAVDSLMRTLPLGVRQLLHRADLDDSDARRRESRGDRAGLVDVLGLDQEEPADLLLRLGERPVGRGDLTATDADGPRGVRGLQSVRDDVMAAPPDLLVVVE